ncbi:right-handed parallel beta-helix repeat-containing protein [Cnuibacter physcomitrellae]|uniref:right-handed parallel beta-helix repeat-containing protein n=1 Tax=Cnuibacter physcomitrellae TaxID=1619308 RepID=UPI00217575D1|nr:right-handed parallel beta-helix repeat-containing protein [Cnuibacter physcomitrellae]MCS5497438.1 right-handed parallel beta-helix repeat-containing protein [Cnuibacter physcomitrellae]
MRIRRLALATMTALALAAGVLVATPAPAAHAAGTTYYVDATGGSDTNTGTSESAAWKSLAKVNALTASAGDRILLKAGSTWTNQYLDLKGSGSPTAPVLVGRYGTGAKPRIDFGNTSVGGEGFGVRVTNGSWWTISDLEITSGPQPTSLRRNGILILGAGSGGGAFSGITILNNDIHDVFGKDRRTGGINLHARQSAASDPESTWDGVLIQGNTVDNVADTGIQTMTDAFLAGSSWVHTHDAFTNVVIRGNTVTRIHRDGILVRAGVGPLVEYNTTDRIGKYTTVDTSVVTYLPAVSVVAAQWAYYTSGAVFQYNEASRTRRIDGDGQPWDFDVEVTDSVYQYNYSHDNEGGTLLMMDHTADNVFRYNISQNDLDRSGGAFSIPFGGGALAVYNNTFYRSAGQTGLLTTSNSAGVATYTNNVFVNAASGTYAVGGGAVYSNNTFFGANSSAAPHTGKLTSDPLLAAPGTATSIADAAAAYTLGSTSPSRDSGATITSNGGLDFSGRQVPQGSGPDRGAVEGSPASILSSETFESGGFGGWAAVSGTWTVGGQPGALRQASTSGEAIATTGSTAWTDYTLSARMAVGTANGNAGVLLRYTDSSNFLLLRVNLATSALELYSKVAGTLTLVASAPVTVPTGRLMSLRADVRGSTVTGWLNGSPLLTWTNPVAQLTAGKVGVRSASSAAVFDEVVVRG